MKKSSEYNRILIMRTVGNFLVLGSLFMIVKTFYAPVAAELTYRIDQYNHTTYVAGATSTSAGAGRAAGFVNSMFARHKVQVLTPVDPDFSIVIPKVGANSRVIADVDPSDESAYLQALEHGVAHTAGTAYPGQGGHIYMFAHSTDYIWNVGTYNAVFYLLYKLERGDEVDIFYHGQRYLYKVVGKEVVNPDQTEYLTRKSSQEFLTLQTCWPPGTTLKRMLVYATRVAE